MAIKTVLIGQPLTINADWVKKKMNNAYNKFHDPEWVKKRKPVCNTFSYHLKTTNTRREQIRSVQCHLTKTYHLSIYHAHLRAKIAAFI